MSRFQMLSDAQWSLIEGMLPRPTGRPGRRFSDARTMVEGIVYRYRTGIAWRDLPEVFGPWQTVWTWHRRMAFDGTWDRVAAKITAAADAAGMVDWSLSVDSTIARAHQHATNTTRLTGAGSNYTDLTLEPPDHGIGRSRGGLSTKIHQLVDGNGLPLVTLITPGQAGDSPMFLPLMAQLRVGRGSGRPRTRPDAVRADKAYSSRAIRGHLRSRGIKAVIPEPDDQKGHRERRGSRGGRPVGLDTADYKNRNVIERGYCRIKQWRGIATRYDKHAVIYRAAVVLNAIIAWTKALSDMP
ncbi:MAG: IS5/IS1182 family transposase [Croceicoccus sp.]|uniref:IS5 family transposase n=1 Tax=Microbacterium sp. TaxID=51671 RepID=UPI000C6784CA|nr:IS5 family transposase [Microbacterium sp.]MAL27744.1 IS5/IS1182 family transposase [Croceicoccus sp.]MAY49637.1 IS5/IS1182 family transposase [Microbacterium sp.]